MSPNLDIENCVRCNVFDKLNHHLHCFVKSSKYFLIGKGFRAGLRWPPSPVKFCCDSSAARRSALAEKGTYPGLSGSTTHFLLSFRVVSPYMRGKVNTMQ